MKLYHERHFGANELLGELEIPVAFYMNRGIIDVWRKWQEKKSAGVFKEGKGHVHFQISFKRSSTFAQANFGKLE